MYIKTRTQFTPHDYQYIARALGQSTSEQSAVLELVDDMSALNELLHDKRLFQNTTNTPPLFLSISPSLYFYLFVHQALETRDLADDDLVDYVSGVFVEFKDTNKFWQFSTTENERMVYFVDLLQLMKDLEQVQQYYLHQYIGNAALFLTGFFPDLIYRRDKRKGAPPLEYYESIGRSQYDMAAMDSIQYESDATPVLKMLAENFTEVRSALNVYVDGHLNLHNRKDIMERIERQLNTLDEESITLSLKI